MEPPRPPFGEYRSASHDTLRSGAPSPRIEHFDGEVPPALSPLDAFAAQGRLLARQLEESARRNRRLSRLPPSSVARSLSQPRPGYFRSPSSTESSHSGRGGGLSRQPTQRINLELEEPKFRPQSEHPRLSAVSHLASDDGQSGDENATPRNESTTMYLAEPNPYDFPRAESPESLREAPETPRRFYAAGLPTPPPVGVNVMGPSRNSSTDSASRLNVARSLAPPPASPYSRPSTSSRGTQPESSDDDYSSSNAGSTFSKPRKLSAGSAVSMPYSPMSTVVRAQPRSPSLSSETSNTGGHHLARPSYNFSRPLSRSSTSLSAPMPTTTSDAAQPQLPGGMTRARKPSPIMVPPDGELAKHAGEDPSSALSSYIYAKYSLPRGRMVSRDSVVFSGLQTPNFEWREPIFKDHDGLEASEPARSARTPSPCPSQAESVASHKARSLHEPSVSERQTLAPNVPPPSQRQSPSPEPAPAPASTPASAPSDTVAPEGPSASVASQGEDQSETTSSADSASTLRPQTARATTPSTVVTADEHVSKGIECHEKGSLQESTYHLRIAAKQNHPTGMLLYALACRHGWGMRPNQREGVQWLRKAVDSVGVELMDDTQPQLPARVREMQKAYRAQFALSVYELGVSHLNGWGIEQDKSLALRCFEIAGQWGDADALAEAGFCYAEGVGCKKDLKKAAKYYRRAEAKGMNIVGNSWYVLVSVFLDPKANGSRIYKDKYMSDDESKATSRGRGHQAGTPEKKRSKSRHRSLFQRKKSATEA
ncbi:cell cycle inhibitor Nif1 [Aspergillus terreus]|uniref:Cell cycle inhibitor Nif1 n=1 Tax=Aspergillus terreus TaxID=33178 RepID=A0A5M3YUN1_ASPTE|nr:hypothetical protein ATETN484_0004003900 [Aspergillus terreus]GFF12929.1 cell cycle inhibitor Nif1 [Aspergillus terreus]